MSGTDWLRDLVTRRKAKPVPGGTAYVYCDPASADPTLPMRLDLGGGLLIAYGASGRAEVVDRPRAKTGSEHAEDCTCNRAIYSRCYPGRATMRT